MDFLLWQFSNSNRNALPPPSPPPPTRAPAPVTSLNGARGRRGIVVVVVVVSPVTVHHTHCVPAEAARLPCLVFLSAYHVCPLCLFIFISIPLLPPPFPTTPFCHKEAQPFIFTNDDIAFAFAFGVAFAVAWLTLLSVAGLIEIRG